MAAGNKTYARNDQVRLHLFVDGVGIANPDPVYASCMGVDALTHALGDVTPVEVPDPDRYGEYIIVDGIPGQRSRWTTTLQTRMIVGEESPLKALARQAQCGMDAFLTRGVCDVPTDYNQFAELIVLEDMQVTNYTTSSISAISSDAREATTESTDVSIGNVYTVYNLMYALTASPSEASGVPQGIVIAPSWCCGSNQCGVMFVASKGHLYFCTRGTCTDTAYAQADIGGMVTVGNRLVVARDDVGLDVILYDKNGIRTTTTKTISGFGDVSSIDSNGRYGVVASLLKVSRFDATATNVTTTDVTTLAGASATKIADVSVSPNGVAVGVSDKGYPMYSKDGVEWTAATVLNGTTPVGTAICAMSDEVWIAGDTAGTLQLTSDSGATWTTVLDVVGTVNDIKRVTKHVAFAAIGSSLYRTVDGGATWNLEPNVIGRTFVSVTSVNKIAACPDDINRLALACVASSALRVVTGRVA